MAHAKLLLLLLRHLDLLDLHALSAGKAANYLCQLHGWCFFCCSLQVLQLHPLRAINHAPSVSWMHSRVNQCSQEIVLVEVDAPDTDSSSVRLSDSCLFLSVLIGIAAMLMQPTQRLRGQWWMTTVLMMICQTLLLPMAIALIKRMPTWTMAKSSTRSLLSYAGMRFHAAS